MIYLYTCFSSLPYVFFPPEKRWISKMQAIHENYFQKEEDLVKKKTNHELSHEENDLYKETRKYQGKVLFCVTESVYCVNCDPAYPHRRKVTL